MEVHLSPEQEQRLSQLATRQGRDADALAQEAISRYLEEEARFIEAVKLGEEDLDRIFKRIEQDNPTAARQVVKTIYEGCAALKRFSPPWTPRPHDGAARIC